MTTRIAATASQTCVRTPSGWAVALSSIPRVPTEVRASPASCSRLLAEGMAGVSYRDVIGGTLDIAILALPHMANFDEFDPLARRDGVRLRYVRQASDFGRPDLLIIPGSKTTVDDLHALRQSGLEESVRGHLAADRPLIGVCGGMQMLGSSIHDPDGVESDQPEVDGLNILDIDTNFMGDKLTTRTRGTIVGSTGLLAGATGLPFAGYEIHVGVSDSRGLADPGDESGRWRAASRIHGQSRASARHVRPRPLQE